LGCQQAVVEQTTTCVVSASGTPLPVNVASHGLVKLKVVKFIQYLKKLNRELKRKAQNSKVVLFVSHVALHWKDKDLTFIF